MQRVLLDCDGVLADWLGGVLDLIFEYSGKRRQPQEVTTWDPWSQFGLTSKQRDLVFEAMSEPAWHESLGVLPGAQAAVEELRRYAEVRVVTSPWDGCPTWHFERMRWLQKHFGLPRDKVIATSGKEAVTGDYFVDDKAVNVRKWLEHNSGLGLLWNAPYNQGVDLPRLHKWQALINAVERNGVAP